jgi:hypothetical protein
VVNAMPSITSLIVELLRHKLLAQSPQLLSFDRVSGPADNSLNALNSTIKQEGSVNPYDRNSYALVVYT